MLPAVSAQDTAAASRCIRVGSGVEHGERVAHIENTCKTRVRVAWCVRGGEREKVECGGDKYFQLSSTFNPGERYTSRLRVPSVGKIIAVGCYATGRRIESDPQGRYVCPGRKPPKWQRFASPCRSAKHSTAKLRVFVNARGVTAIQFRSKAGIRVFNRASFVAWANARKAEKIHKQPVAWVPFEIAGKQQLAPLTEKTLTAAICGAEPLSPRSFGAAKKALRERLAAPRICKPQAGKTVPKRCFETTRNARGTRN